MGPSSKHIAFIHAAVAPQQTPRLAGAPSACLSDRWRTVWCWPPCATACCV